MLYLAFSKKRKEVKELIRTFNRNRWAKFLDKGVKIVARKNAKHKLSAVRDETGNLLTSPDKVMQRWSEFYTALSRDSTGNSRSPDRWIEVLGNKKDNPLDINHDISWDEVRIVLMSLALQKAPAAVPGNSVKIPGLLFADDLVLLADSEVGLRENLLVVKWANDNEMSLGISKYGALVVGGSFEHPDILELQGQTVLIVKEYWYLGVLINDELDLLKFCRHKFEKAEACYANIRRLLSSKSVPMASRVLFLRGVLETRMRYGGEILGMFRDRSRSLQRVLNNGLKNLIGVSERETIVKIGNLWFEFEVPPLMFRQQSHCFLRIGLMGHEEKSPMAG
ncbi:hypothetical protein AYI69_g7739 [Smittium culicis]|uniref:Reverse transcriptase domain-containing protein n=1 Tax=Smittium culicis TaxID=133412 RepID=A0A1R1XQ18_9FUNG|nr:hypothetical protein AYI69_g7739 [Smittium culicis]